LSELDRRRVWVMNFDADDELGNRDGAGNPSKEMRARFAALTSLVAELTGGDVVLDPAAPDAKDAKDARAAGAEGFSWCPTPSALRALRAANARVPAAPPLSVLRRANHRRFSAELGQTLDGAVFFDRVDDAVAHLSKHSPTGTWVVKRPFSFAGRGRVFVRASRALDEHLGWLRASASDLPGDAGGLQVEPWVARLGDYAQHGFVDRDGAVTIGAPTKQICDARGVWSASTRDHDLAPEETHALAVETERSAGALADIGYFGPFGVDAFRYSTEAAAGGSSARFCPRIEINARYTMGWAVGMAERRVDLACFSLG
jgi:hypothetical protein